MQPVDLLGGVLREDGGPEDTSGGRADVLHVGDGDPRSMSSFWTFFMSSADFMTQVTMGTGLSFISKPSFLRPSLAIWATFRRSRSRRWGSRMTICIPSIEEAAAGVGLGVAPGVGAARRLDVVDEGLAPRDEAAVAPEGLAHRPGEVAAVGRDPEVVVGPPAVRAENADGVGVVEAEDAVVGLDGLDVFGHGGDDAEGREDAVGHDEGHLAGLEFGLELPGEVLGVPVPEHGRPAYGPNRRRP